MLYLFIINFLKMKQLKSFFSGIVVVSSLLITLASCEKKEAFEKETGEVSEDTKNIQSCIDAVMNEVNGVFSEKNEFYGRSDFTGAYKDSICGVEIDKAQKDLGIIVFNFDGKSNCSNRIRSGKIELSLQNYSSGKRWSDENASIQVMFIDFKVTEENEGKNHVFNGLSNLKNISGGNAAWLVSGLQNQLIQDLTGNDILVQSKEGESIIFSLSRRYTHSFKNKVYQIEGEGTGTNNGRSNLESWGTTRDGDNFTSQILETVLWNSVCGHLKPIKGKFDIKVDKKDFNFITTLGVDENGNIMNSGCPWGLKVEWTFKNKAGSKLFEYQ